MTERVSDRLARTTGAYAVYAAARGAAFDRSVLALFLLAHGLSPAELGTLQSILFSSQMLTEVPAGYFGDRFGRKASVTAGLVGKVLWCGGMIVADGFAQFAALFVFAGLSRSLVSGSDHSLVYDLMKEHGRAERFVAIEAKARALGGIAFAASMAVGGYLLKMSSLSLYGAYLATSAAALLAWLAVGSPRDTGSDSRAANAGSARADRSWKRAFTGRKTRVLVAMVMGIAALASVVGPFYFFAQADMVERGLSAEEVGLVYGLTELVASLTLLAAKPLEKHLVFLEIFAAFSLLSSGALFVAALPGRGALLLGFLLLVLGCPLLDVVVLHAMHRKLSSRLRSSLMSVVSVVMTLGMTVGYAGWGALRGWTSTSMTMACAAVVPLVALAVVLLLTRGGRLFDPTATVEG